MKRWVGIGLLVLALVITASLVALSPVVAFVFGANRLITFQQRILLYHLDHNAMGILLRDFAFSRRWSLNPAPKGDYIAISGDDPSLPPALRLLKPSVVIIFDDCVELDFGGALLHYGIRAYRPGRSGRGTKQLAEGLWFYAENDRYPMHEW